MITFPILVDNFNDETEILKVNVPLKGLYKGKTNSYEDIYKANEDHLDEVFDNYAFKKGVLYLELA